MVRERLSLRYLRRESKLPNATTIASRCTRRPSGGRYQKKGIHERGNLSYCGKKKGGEHSNSKSREDVRWHNCVVKFLGKDSVDRSIRIKLDVRGRQTFKKKGKKKRKESS